jgi:hypothetical protein
MTNINFGNSLNGRNKNALYALFEVGEIFQLTFSSFEEMKKRIENDISEVFTLSYPIGFKPDKTSLLGKREYQKTDLLGRISNLSNEKLALNGIYQLITIVEAYLGDLIRLIILRYPKKIGGKRTIQCSEILEADDMESIYLKVANSVLNELSYKSPREFAEESKKITSINFLECPTFHKYVEIKATRDIHIHNLGIANELYLSKASTHSRAKLGQYLHVDNIYLLESYEACLQFIEWLELKLHEVWPSSDYEERIEEKNKEKLEKLAQPSASPDPANSAGPVS